MRFTLKSNQNWSEYIDKLSSFLGNISKRVNKPLSQYLLLVLLYNYLKNKEIYKKSIKNIELVKEKFTEDYFKNLFSVKENGKIKKLVEGARLNLAQKNLETLLSN